MVEQPEQPILVVEDDVQLLEALVRSFRDAGRRVVACATFEEGRQALRSQQFYGLLTDVRLGAFNGLQLAVIARDLQPDMKLIVYSGYDDPVLRTEAERIDAIYLVKPITTAQLLQLFAQPRRQSDTSATRDGSS